LKLGFKAGRFGSASVFEGMFRFKKVGRVGDDNPVSTHTSNTGKKSD